MLNTCTYCSTVPSRVRALREIVHALTPPPKFMQLAIFWGIHLCAQL